MHTAPATKTKDCGAADCRSGKRNRFFLHKQMRAEEFAIEQRYFIERRRLINRGVLGWGVVFGFPLALNGGKDAKDSGATVGRGLAFDRYGREAMLAETTAIGADNTFLLTGTGHDCRMQSPSKIEAGRYVLAIHYAERQIEDAKTARGCGCKQPEKKFTCETAVFSLRKLNDGCECPCAEAKCERHCKCSAKDCCGETGRGPHSCLCQWVTEADVAHDPAPLCEWEGVWLSPCDGVDLACVTVARTEDKCRPFVISAIDDDCGPRRLVKGNDLLYDLARGCDLTHISEVSWADWHRQIDPPVPWEKFAQRLGKGGATDFFFRFDGPVLEKTIRLDTVVMTVFTAEQPTGWRIARRIPIEKLELTQTGSLPDYPPGTIDQVRLIVRPRWIADEVEKDSDSWLTERVFRVEIEIRCNTILTCNHQAVDGDAIGLVATPSGNGTPGGTYLSSFRVLPKPRGEPDEGE